MDAEQLTERDTEGYVRWGRTDLPGGITELYVGFGHGRSCLYDSGRVGVDGDVVFC
jgi:hypothetical protein